MWIFLLSLGLVVACIAGLRLHPFVALSITAVAVGVAGSDVGGLGAVVPAIEAASQAFGQTASGIALVIVLAALIGQCLTESGAADRIVRWLVALFGEKRAALALLASGYLLSVPVFFDTVFFLLIPLARALARRTGRNYVLYVMAICAGGLVTHSLVPPTPGPLVMVEQLPGITTGGAIGWGVLLGILPALAALGLAGRLDRRLAIPLRPTEAETEAHADETAALPDSALPGLGRSLLPVVLPVVLITGHAVLAALAGAGTLAVSGDLLQFTTIAGNKNIALAVAALAAALVLKRHKGLSLATLGRHIEPAITSAGLIILITAAGGAFGKMLAQTNLSSALKGLATDSNGDASALGWVLMAWGIAAAFKVAQGSSTVAMITVSGLLGPMLASLPAPPCPVVLIYAAIGLGSLFGSWMNDSGFWVVAKMAGFTERETLSTWTPLLSALSLVGLVQLVVLVAFIG